jgi:hypothetical protein
VIDPVPADEVGRRPRARRHRSRRRRDVDGRPTARVTTPTAPRTSTRRPNGRRGGGLRRPVGHPRLRRRPHPPARARLRGRGGHRDRLGGRCRRRLHGPVPDGEHRPRLRQPPPSRSWCGAAAARSGSSTCSRSGRSPRGSPGRSSPSSASSHHSAARIDFFSDDGMPVADALVMRRALQYALAFDAVLCNHAQDPSLTADAQMNEGEWSSVLGLPGWPHEAEEVMIARDLILAAGARRPPARPARHHRRRGRADPAREGARHPGHRRGDPAPPEPDRRPRRLLRPGAEGQPAGAHRPGTSMRCAPRSPTGPSTRSRPTMRRTPRSSRTRSGSTPPAACSAWRPRSRSSTPSWSPRAARRRSTRDRAVDDRPGLGA